VFYVRVHTTAGDARSGPSNEIPIHVGVPALPSAPAGLLGLADGSGVTLVWRNTLTGGAPSGVVLDVSGATSASIPLALTDRFTAAGVPPGTYAVSVRAVNASGSSGPSNTVTLTFPGACLAPDMPAEVAVSKNGRTIFVTWAPPLSGAAPSEYLVDVSGAFTGTLPTSALAMSGAAAPGTYAIAVRARNACGASPPTPSQTVTIS
jgi:predicted phage tail protein